MDQRISFVTLAVADLAASRCFYLDGLGWRAELDVPGEVLMIRVGEHLILSLWDATEFEGEVGTLRRGEGCSYGCQAAMVSVWLSVAVLVMT